MANPDETLYTLSPDSGQPDRGLIRGLSAVSIYLNKGLAWLAAVSLMLMMLVTVANAAARVVYVPFVGASELVGWLAALTIAFALGFTQLQQGYVEIDALVERFPQILQRIIKSVMLIISMLFFTMVSWQLILYAQTVKSNGNLSESMGIVYYPLIYLLAVGFFGLTIALLVDSLKEIVGSAGK